MNRLEILKTMVAQNPADSFSRYGLAMEYANSGSLDKAVEEYESLLSLNPDYAAAYYHGAQALEKLGRIDDARRMYTRGLEATRRTATRTPTARSSLSIFWADNSCMVWFLALWLLSAAPQKWPIESLTVEGLKNYSQAQALSVAGLKVGQLAGTQDFEAARDRLLATGVFETAGYRFAPSAGSNGYAASFQVVEVEPVYPVRIEGLNAPDSEIQAWLQEGCILRPQDTRHRSHLEARCRRD